MTRDRSELGRALANIDQQIGELQLVRQMIIDAFGPARELGIVKERLGDVPKRGRRSKAEMAAVGLCVGHRDAADRHAAAPVKDMISGRHGSVSAE